MRRILYDSSVYIDAFRRGDPSLLAARGRVADSVLYVSAVVLEELYAGANARARRLLGRLERDFDRVGRILVPNLTDWTATGHVLAMIGERYGYEQIGKGRLTNDGLIAMSAVRQGVTVLTLNGRDFARLAQMRSEFQWEVAGPQVSP